jgi:hypothetical protein
MTDFAADKQFEDEVRRIARARWPQAAFGGSRMLQGRERDGVFETDDVIHFIEATTSRRADKAREDTKKLFGAMVLHQRSGSLKGAVGWLITKEEPTVDQNEAVRDAGKQQVKICSFAQFQQALVDVAAYLSARERHFFGSVTDPVTGGITPQGEYVALDITSTETGESYSVASVCESLRQGKSFVLLGDYGAGKSMTLRQIFFDMRRQYLKGGTPLFPVYINLREHSGQDDPSELLERHARRIGFDKPHTLVHAWRAGFAVLLLDGFDEITTLGAANFRTKLRETRRRSLEAVRKLIEQTPLTVGVAIAGREHFFNSPEERNQALGLRHRTVSLNLSELSSKQVKEFLRHVAGSTVSDLPDWLPSRPLLVGYIAARGLMADLESLGNSLDPVDGWNYLLDRIFHREARISPNLDGPVLRHILERLATVARSTSDGLGPITQEQIRTAFLDICETEPDEQSNLLLQRLPGLGVFREEENSRTFVDQEMAGVCRARDLQDFVQNPYGTLQLTGTNGLFGASCCFIGETALTRAARNLGASQNFAVGQIEAALNALRDKSEPAVLRADTIALSQALKHSPQQRVEVENVIFDQYTLSLSSSACDLSNVLFRNCVFECVEIEPDVDALYLPRLESCIVLTVFGRTSKEDLPRGLVDSSCEIERFAESAKTLAAIMETSLTKGEKVVLTLLRKLFVQSLSGRAESALTRGLDLNDRQLVPRAMTLLQQHGFVVASNRGDSVWLPVRRQLGRARRMLATPMTCGEKLLLDAKLLVSA